MFVKYLNLLIISCLFLSCSKTKNKNSSSTSQAKSKNEEMCFTDEMMKQKLVNPKNLKKLEKLKTYDISKIIGSSGVNVEIFRPDDPLKCDTVHIKARCNNKKCYETLTTTNNLLIPKSEGGEIKVEGACCVSRDFVKPELLSSIEPTYKKYGQSFYCGTYKENEQSKKVAKAKNNQIACSTYWDNVTENRDNMLAESIKMCKKMKNSGIIKNKSQEFSSGFKLVSCLSFAEKAYLNYSQEENQKIINSFKSNSLALSEAKPSGPSCINLKSIENFVANSTSSSLSLAEAGKQGKSDKDTDKDKEIPTHYSLAETCSDKYKYKELSALSDSKWSTAALATMTAGMIVFAIGAIVTALTVTYKIMKGIYKTGASVVTGNFGRDFDIMSNKIKSKSPFYSRVFKKTKERKLKKYDNNIKQKFEDLEKRLDELTEQGSSKSKNDDPQTKKIRKEIEDLIAKRNSLESYASSRDKYVKEHQKSLAAEATAGQPLLDKTSKKLQSINEIEKFLLEDKMKTTVNSRIKRSYKDRLAVLETMNPSTKTQVDIKSKMYETPSPIFKENKTKFSTSTKVLAGGLAATAIGAAATYFSGTYGLSSDEKQEKKIDPKKLHANIINVMAAIQRRNELNNLQETMCGSVAL